MIRICTLNSPEPPCVEQEVRPYGATKELDLDQIDLLPYLDFDMEAFHSDTLKVNPRLKVMAISCKTGEGLDTWFSWIEERAGKKGS